MSTVEVTPIQGNFKVVNISCDNKGNSRNAQVTFGWPRPSYYYHLSIAFSAVSYC